MRQMASSPSDLELTLIDGPENVKGDSELMEIAAEAKSYGFHYAMVAKCPSKTNKETGSELGDVLNSMYQSDLYKDGSQYRGSIFVEENGHYLQD